jgi:hypothetical protein
MIDTDLPTAFELWEHHTAQAENFMRRAEDVRSIEAGHECQAAAAVHSQLALAAATVAALLGQMAGQS